MRSPRGSLWLVLVALLAAPAAAQLQTGDLLGRVTDVDGQALPGVSIDLSGVGAPRQAITDEVGDFRFLGLFPGEYRLEATLDGFNKVEYPAVGVRLGGSTQIEVTLTAALAESITVTGEAPLLDERRANRGASVPAQDLDQIPTARDPWSLLSLAPGVLVDRVNLGGNESGQQSTFTGLASTSRENVFAVDGVVLTDMNAVGASATYFDFGAFEEVQLTVSSTDVSVATAGVTINQVTKRGTNDWRAQARYLRTDGDWQSDPVFADGNRIDLVEEYGADVGGPIVRDRLWIWGAYGESDIGNLVPAGGGGSQLDRTQLEDFNAKLNFAANEKLSGVLHWWSNDKLKFGRGASPSRAPETTLDQTTPQDIYKIEASWLPTSSLFVTGLWGRDDGIFTLSPQGGLDADIFVDENNVRRGTWFDFTQEAVIDQWRVDSSYFFSTGEASHELKFGGGFREQENLSGTVWPRGKIVWHGDLFGLDPGMAAVGFQRNRSVSYVTSYQSAWVQDTMTLDRWTVTAGVRWDHQEGENLASSDAGNPEAPAAEEGGPPVIPSLDFPGNDAGGFDWDSVVPRVGVTYALGEDRKTLLRGTFSQYAEQLGQNPLIGRVNPLGYSYAYFYFADANGNLRLDQAERPSLYFAYAVGLDPNNPTSLSSPNINDPDLGPQRTSELTFGVDHALRDDLGVGLTFTWRNVTDVPEERVLLVDEAGNLRVATRADWVQAGFTDPGVLPNGSPAPSRPVFDLREGLTPTGGTYYTNGDRELEYRGVTLALDKRLRDRWSLRGHFTWSDSEWTIGPEYRRHEDPTDSVADARGFPDDEGDPFFEQSGGNKADVFVSGAWSFNVSGIYQVAPEQPWGFNVGASVDGREGFIAPVFIGAGSAVGQRSVEVVPVDSFALDDVIVLNGHLDKELAFGDTRLVFSLDGFNLLDEDVVLQRNRDAVDEGDFAPQEALSPRVFRAGVTLRFR